jgi:hypothetical protein
MDGANMAAVALQMQHTARQAEQHIYTLEQRLRAALNRPTIVQRSTALITGIAADPVIGYQSIGPAGGGSFVTDFNNTGHSGPIDTGNRTFFEVLGAGLYEFGLSANLVASGAVTDNSYRIFRIVLTRLDPELDLTSPAPFGEHEMDENSLTLFESNTGVGVDATVSAVFRVQEADRIHFVVQHQNLGSSLNASIGTLIWMSKLSTNDAVVVA